MLFNQIIVIMTIQVLSHGEGHYTTKADVYSFGIVLFVRTNDTANVRVSNKGQPNHRCQQELLTKRTPFEELKFDYQVEAAIMDGQRPIVVFPFLLCFCPTVI